MIPELKINIKIHSFTLENQNPLGGLLSQAVNLCNRCAENLKVGLFFKADVSLILLEWQEDAE